MLESYISETLKNLDIKIARYGLCQFVSMYRLFPTVQKSRRLRFLLYSTITFTSCRYLSCHYQHTLRKCYFVRHYIPCILISLSQQCRASDATSLVNGMPHFQSVTIFNLQLSYGSILEDMCTLLKAIFCDTNWPCSHSTGTTS